MAAWFAIWMTTSTVADIIFMVTVGAGWIYIAVMVKIVSMAGNA
jgi:hypothetical protein